MAQKTVKKHDPRPSPTPPPGTPDLEAEEARLLAQLKTVRMAKQATANQSSSSQVPTSSSSLAPAPAPASVSAEGTASTSDSSPPAAHHTSTAPSRKKAPIPKVKSKIKNLAAYLEETVQMDKAMYNFLLRVVRSACGIVKPNDTWSSLSHEKKNLILRAITEQQDNKPLLPYLRNRFENDWVVETAIIRHLQERKRGKKRAVENLDPDDDTSPGIPSPPSASAMSIRQSIDPTPDDFSPDLSDPILETEPSTASVLPAAKGSHDETGGTATRASAITPSPPIDAHGLPQATKKPLRTAEANADDGTIASTSNPGNKLIVKSSLSKISAKKGSTVTGKRKAAEAGDVATDENEVETPPAPPLKKSRTKKATTTLPSRSNPKRSTKGK